MGPILVIVRMAVASTAHDRFPMLARTCFEAALVDSRGTTAYEWFLSDDGRECTAIEIYEDASAFSRHGKMVGTAIAALQEICVFDIEIAGDVPEPMLHKLRERLGDVGYAGPLFNSRHRIPANLMTERLQRSTIFMVERHAIETGCEAAWKSHAKAYMAWTALNAHGCILDEWFVHEAKNTCLRLSIYSDATALRAYLLHRVEAQLQLADQVTVETKIYGALPSDLRISLEHETSSVFVAPCMQGLM